MNKIVIEISSYDKEWITNGYYIPEEINMRISEAIANGTPIPDDATNGDVIKALFPNEHDFETDFDEEWWNRLYQKGDR